MNISTFTKEYKPGKEVVFVKVRSESLNSNFFLDVKDKINTTNQIILIDPQMKNGVYPKYSDEKIEFELEEFIKRNFHKLLNDFFPFNTK